MKEFRHHNAIIDFFTTTFILDIGFYADVVYIKPGDSDVDMDDVNANLNNADTDNVDAYIVAATDDGTVAMCY